MTGDEGPDPLWSRRLKGLGVSAFVGVTVTAVGYGAENILTPICLGPGILAAALLWPGGIRLREVEKAWILLAASLNVVLITLLAWSVLTVAASRRRRRERRGE